jgi:cell division protein FtsL
MADTVQIGNTGQTAKIRHPVAVAIFSFITLGIYYVYWWYQVNREVMDLGRARNVDGLGDNPTLSALAVFPGVLVIVPPFVTLYNGVKRFQRAQETTLEEATLSGWIVLVLVVAAFIVGVAAPIIPGYVQAELNKIWEGQPRLGVEAAAGDADLDEKARVLRSPQGSTTDHP